ncbi:hypothetical protein ACOME3_007988 [Neoechinorhynchus agilis]
MVNKNIKVRILSVEPSLQRPIKGIDSLYSRLTGTRNRKVPILRVFGTADNGQSCCVYVHNVYPYFYIRSPIGRSEDSRISNKEKSIINEIVDKMKCSLIANVQQQSETNSCHGPLIYNVEKLKKT